MENYEFHVMIEQDEDGVYVAEVPAIRACYAQGRTFEEAIENVCDVLKMCLREMIQRGEEIPRPGEIVGLKRVEVAV